MRDEELEQRLQDAVEELPTPAEDVTRAARSRALSAIAGRPAGRRAIVRVRRTLSLAAAGLAVFGLAAGFALGRTTAPDARTRTVTEPLAATGGPGFLPASGWNAMQTGDTVLPQAGSAVAATVRILDPPGSAPQRTLATLGPGDVLVQANIYGRAGFRPALDRGFPPRRAPLHLPHGDAAASWEGGSGWRYVITARVQGWVLETIVYFGASPTAETRRLASEALGRMILPSPCPSRAEPLSGAALDGAMPAVRHLLFVRVDESVQPPADYRDPRLEVRRATESDVLPPVCGTVPRSRVAVVEVRYPHLADRPALGRQTYLASRQHGRYVVWARVR